MGLKKEKEKKANDDEVKNENAASANAAENAAMKNDAVAEEEAIAMVMLPAEDVERLKEEAGKNLENWQRERADFVNYKKRIEREQEQFKARLTGDIIKKFLPVIDDFERAMKVLPTGGQEASWSEGIDLIYRKLQLVVEQEGVTRIPADEFDPTRHEAITHEPSPDHKSGEIIEIVQQGYMLGDRVIRPALVRVAQ